MAQNCDDQSKLNPVTSPTVLSSDQQTKIDGLLSRWNAVQGRLKSAEQISQIAMVPAINELRYAGRMLVAAMSQTQPTAENGLPTLDEAIITASQYITNAEHDISDALVYFYQKKTDDLNSRFGAQTIRDEFPDYGKLLDCLKSARGLVIVSRADMAERKSNYEKLIGLMDEITALYFKILDADTLFSLEVEHYRARIRLWKTVGVVAAVIAGVAIVLSFLF